MKNPPGRGPPYTDIINPWHELRKWTRHERQLRRLSGGEGVKNPRCREAFSAIEKSKAATVFDRSILLDNWPRTRTRRRTGSRPSASWPHFRTPRILSNLLPWRNRWLFAFLSGTGKRRKVSLTKEICRGLGASSVDRMKLYRRFQRRPHNNVKPYKSYE